MPATLIWNTCRRGSCSTRHRRICARTRCRTCPSTTRTQSGVERMRFSCTRCTCSRQLLHHIRGIHVRPSFPEYGNGIRGSLGARMHLAADMGQLPLYHPRTHIVWQAVRRAVMQPTAIFTQYAGRVPIRTKYAPCAATPSLVIACFASTIELR